MEGVCLRASPDDHTVKLSLKHDRACARSATGGAETRLKMAAFLASITAFCRDKAADSSVVPVHDDDDDDDDDKVVPDTSVQVHWQSGIPLAPTRRRTNRRRWRHL